MEDKDGFEEVNLGNEGLIGEQKEKGAKNPLRIPQRSKYFGYPTNWDKSWFGFHTLQHRNNLAQQQNFHKVALNEVRRSLGKKCKHLVHMKTAEGISFKAKIMVNNKIKTFNVDAEVETASKLSAESYKNLKDVLENAIRG